MKDHPNETEPRENASVEVPNLSGAHDQAEEVGSRTEPGQAWSRWRLAAAWGVSIAGAIACTVVATLLATHKAAVRENFIAYANGLSDGYNVGFLDGFGMNDSDDLSDSSFA